MVIGWMMQKLAVIEENTNVICMPYMIPKVHKQQIAFLVFAIKNRAANG